MELVLPNNYVALEQEEMMYLDGGGVGCNWWNSRGSFATVLDVDLAIYSGGATIYSAYAIKKAISANRGAITRTLRSLIIKHVGSAAGHLVNTALTVTGFLLGGAIAYGVDWADGSLDGYIFA
ncbi:TPA: SP_0115 family bacteriocin-like peptide [Streptococcus pneumoniae]|nr:SP_0115 family bacteriocin-like peptide [Streptococcus pneumoniae]HEU2020463.1 SP_0115 family bacteriocin-like peptide [Streptococcus pneumoniae]HEU2470259.1 SP_0115 family bacteriocin-like peptide [Streptococcus pneumoniae]HEU2608986.1 SP_0115 family bacteriocin-like peptide [Streptococcus pneumoniae]